MDVLKGSAQEDVSPLKQRQEAEAAATAPPAGAEENADIEAEEPVGEHPPVR